MEENKEDKKVWFDTYYFNTFFLVCIYIHMIHKEYDVCVSPTYIGISIVSETK